MKLLRLCALLFILSRAGALHAQSIDEWVESICEDCTTRMSSQTGVYILEKGQEALIGRAWLTMHAARSIDVQYFIWSTDNIGILAAAALLRAAERGVRVRVIVDALLIDAGDRTLLLLAAHRTCKSESTIPIRSRRECLGQAEEHGHAVPGRQPTHARQDSHL